MATATLVTIEEYLTTAYRPDVEYLDGELRPKDGKLTEDAVIQWARSQLQALISAWFVQHAEEWKIRTGVEARTRVASGRVRLPDVVVVNDDPQSQTLTEPPLIVIEIVSPSDTYSQLHGRLHDLAAMGVKNLWIVDPQQRSAWQNRDNAWVESKRLSVPDTLIYLDVDALFARL